MAKRASNSQSSRKEKRTATHGSHTHHRVDAHRHASRTPDARLEAAQKRLRETVDRADAFEAIREIVTNLLGCEEIGLFRVNNGTGGLIWSFGIDPEAHGTLDRFDPTLLRRVFDGECHVAQLSGETGSDSPSLRVFVPICYDGRTVAVLVMLKLLPQKMGFDEADLDLVKLLSQESGRALFEGSMSANA